MVTKIPIDNTFNELVEMGRADYGGYAAFLHIQDAFSRFSVSVLWGKEKGGQTAEMVLESVMSHWLAVFGEPGIIAVDKDMGFTGAIFKDFAQLVISRRKP